jgi:hypothetical protein
VYKWHTPATDVPNIETSSTHLIARYTLFEFPQINELDLRLALGWEF